ncbi:OprD family porin [Pseudomonas helleri]|uniref:Outer membrane porin, OprD family n=1 Tax=Pseudomonas helleri TaxID=1608996 RepID=A0A6A7Z008_9PSED|nr:OprD family porin [Pseudomonas helleri]MQT25802.1 outer membrane porin, OprD family [Pseudomonas helleri]MQT81165.1 outer membrane porin, OprD family [Pseudomonas helleri]MQU17053.1 outer membrane porin, OprD family [Pseudomonas helleri]MQU28035.1 outer membrane porin, OprD family [Pseudomonas helleri]
MKLLMNHAVTGAGLIGASLLPGLAHADFIGDSSAALELKNYYFNRDYREDAGQSKRDEWAQGFILKVQSGYTEGTVGFGLDAIGMLGLKLDSSPDRSGTGILARSGTSEPGKPSYARRAEDSYSKLGITGKVRLAKSDLNIGYLVPDMPTLQPNGSRLFAQSFQGAALRSSDIKNLALAAGQIDQVQQRDSMDYEDMGLTSQYGAYKSTAKSDQFRYAGGDYKLTPDMTVSYQFAQLQDLYRQHYVGLKNSFAIGLGALKTDIRYFDAGKDGAGLAGKVDNRALSTRVAYSYKGHTLGGGYQGQYGSTPFTYVDGTNTFLFTEYQLGNFSQTGERSWHARYDYDFAALGVPGLTFSTRYAKGDKAKVIGFAGEGREWERDSTLTYLVQSGTFKNVSLRWQNATANSNYTRDTDENRVIIGYSLALW